MGLTIRKNTTHERTRWVTCVETTFGASLLLFETG
jgi:hypothetical protein